MTEVKDTIRAALAKCESEARFQGHKGDAWRPTDDDCYYVAERVVVCHGRMPTRSEWREVMGTLAYIGGQHYEGE